MSSIDVIFPVLTYAVGCFNAGYYIVRWRTGKDIRSIGSGATGATNVGRLAGWKGFAATTFVDMVKGMLVMWGAKEAGIGDLSMHCSLLAVVAGHIWPVQLGFRGGKGINTSIGALVILQPGLSAFALVLFVLSFLVTKDYLLNGLAVCSLLPVIGIIIGLPAITNVMLVILVGMLLYSQRGNIKEHVGNLRRVEE
jgi:acyl phosphate:glycerol-3-phosphate acyltransferase